ncbi:MAG: hypothetical protein ABI346_01595 [Candidatus Baltobacteraceae bacterium]
MVTVLKTRSAGAEALTAVAPDLRRIVGLLGNNRAAAILGVDKSLVSRWLRGAETISPSKRKAIIDVSYVLQRALQVLTPQQLSLWLVGSDPLLGGARPVDVLMVRGAGQLVAALDAIEQGAFA